MKEVIQTWAHALCLWVHGERCLGVASQKEVPRCGESIRLWRDPRRFEITHLIAQSDGLVAVWVKTYPWLESNTALLEYSSDYLSLVHKNATAPQRTYDDLLLHLENEKLCSDTTAAWITYSLNADGSLRDHESIRTPVFRKHHRSHLIAGWISNELL